jgi:hypothetical protein
MRSLPNLIGQMSGPRTKPLSLGNNYLTADPVYEPNYWTYGYITHRIVGLSIQATLQFDYTVNWSFAGSFGFYKVTKSPENYLPSDSPESNNFTAITSGLGSEFTIENGEYLSISLNSSQLGRDADYAEVSLMIRDVLGNYSSSIGFYTLEIMAP